RRRVPEPHADAPPRLGLRRHRLPEPHHRARLPPPDLADDVPRQRPAARRRDEPQGPQAAPPRRRRAPAGRRRLGRQDHCRRRAAGAVE
ncbi:hypothetical protein BN1708_019953, partial [Verticillium longisporum]